MPLAFATVLGGLMTLIGTPPNLLIAGYRRQVMGESFALFDFAWVGVPLAVIGLAFVTLVGWRLLPVRGAAGGDEIGRASCGERVCQYGEIPGVAVSLKKKNIT